MNNFGRALQVCLRYKWTVGSSLGSALVIAVLWGGNIGAIYPFVEVLLQGKSLQHWVDEEISEAQTKHADLAAQIETLRADAPDPTAAQSQIDQLVGQQEAELHAQRLYEYIRPLIYDYMPTSPFNTVIVLVGVLLVGTLIKDVALVFNHVLTERVAQLAPSTCAKNSIAARCAWTSPVSARKGPANC